MAEKNTYIYIYIAQSHIFKWITICHKKTDWVVLLIMYLKTECVLILHRVLTSILVLCCIINTIYQTLLPLPPSSLPFIPLYLTPFSFSHYGYEVGGWARDVWHSFIVRCLMYCSADAECVHDCSGPKSICSAPLLMIQYNLKIKLFQNTVKCVSQLQLH